MTGQMGGLDGKNLEAASPLGEQHFDQYGGPGRRNTVQMGSLSDRAAALRGSQGLKTAQTLPEQHNHGGLNRADSQASAGGFSAMSDAPSNMGVETRGK
jgi:hypothetical protein